MCSTFQDVIQAIFFSVVYNFFIRKPNLITSPFLDIFFIVIRTTKFDYAIRFRMLSRQVSWGACIFCHNLSIQELNIFALPFLHCQIDYTKRFRMLSRRFSIQGSIIKSIMLQVFYLLLLLYFTFNLHHYFLNIFFILVLFMKINQKIDYAIRFRMSSWRFPI